MCLPIPGGWRSLRAVMGGESIAGILGVHRRGLVRIWTISHGGVVVPIADSCRRRRIFGPCYSKIPTFSRHRVYHCFGGPVFPAVDGVVAHVSDGKFGGGDDNVRVRRNINIVSYWSTAVVPNRHVVVGSNFRSL